MKKKTLETLTIIIGFLTVLILVCNAYILFRQTEILDRTSPSRTADLKIDFSQFGDDNYYYLSMPYLGEKREIDFIFITGTPQRHTIPWT